jgi:hypothetical protein
MYKSVMLTVYYAAPHLSSASVNLSNFDNRKLITSQMSPLLTIIQPQLDAPAAHGATHNSEQQWQHQ